jgi:hypothetical protein
MESGSQMLSKKSWEKPSVETSRFEPNVPESIYEKQRPLNIPSYERKSDVEYEERRHVKPRVEQRRRFEVRPSKEQWAKPSYETTMTSTEKSWKTDEKQLKPTTRISSLEKPSFKRSTEFQPEKIQRELEQLETPALAQVVAQQPSEMLPKKQKAIYEEIVIERRRVPMSTITPSPLAVGVERNVGVEQPIQQPTQQPIQPPIERPVQPVTPFKPVSPIQQEQLVQPVSTVQPATIVEETKVKGVNQPEWVESRTVSSATTHFSFNFLSLILFSTLFAFIVSKIF